MADLLSINPEITILPSENSSNHVSVLVDCGTTDKGTQTFLYTLEKDLFTNGASLKINGFDRIDNGKLIQGIISIVTKNSELDLANISYKINEIAFKEAVESLGSEQDVVELITDYVHGAWQKAYSQAIKSFVFGGVVDKTVQLSKKQSFVNPNAVDSEGATAFNLGALFRKYWSLMFIAVVLVLQLFVVVKVYAKITQNSTQQASVSTTASSKFLKHSDSSDNGVWGSKAFSDEESKATEKFLEDMGVSSKLTHEAQAGMSCLIKK